MPSDNEHRLTDLRLSTLSRRRLIQGALAGAGVLTFPGLLAACGDDDDDDTGTAGGGGGDQASTELEVFSWWTGGGEAAGLEAMIEIWNRDYPDVEFVNAAVAGGAGSNAKAVLAQRLTNNQPPDSFQGHAGAELSDYILQEQVEPLNDLFDEEGFNDVFPEQLVEQITVDGSVYSVPVNIHRANVLWYSPALLEAAGVTAPPASLDDFADALDAVKTTGKTPLSVAEQWTVKHLMETVLLGDLGADGYADLFKPGADWGSSDVTETLERFKGMLDFVNTNFASLTWQDAAKQVVDGQAAFNVMGDWAFGYFLELGKTAETDYNWAATPGTDGVYQWLSDSFTLAKGAPHADAALEWLKLCGSKEGQDAFNPVKGSIPARQDADRSKYTSYLEWALDQWQESDLVGSLHHGVVANLSWSTEIDGALGLFLSGKNVGNFQDALGEAYETYGPK